MFRRIVSKCNVILQLFQSCSNIEEYYRITVIDDTLDGTFYRKVTSLNVNGLGQSRCTFSHRGDSLCEKKASYAHYRSVFEKGPYLT